MCRSGFQPRSCHRREWKPLLQKPDKFLILGQAPSICRGNSLKSQRNFSHVFDLRALNESLPLSTGSPFASGACRGARKHDKSSSHSRGMPRKARIDAPGALHHIILRGIKRQQIFRDDADRDFFVARLGQVLAETGTDCFAWALIPNKPIPVPYFPPVS